MVGRVLQAIGAVLVVAVAFVTPVFVTATSTPAGADTVIDGCTIVSNPTSSSFTNCPNTNFSGANLLGVNLDYANLAGSTFSNTQLAQCALAGFPPLASCSSSTTFEHATLSQAAFSSAVTTSCVTAQGGSPTLTNTTCTGADLSNANLQSADLSGLDLSDVNLASADLVGANISGATFVTSYQIGVTGVFQYFGTNFTAADLAGLNLSGLDLRVATLTSANLTGSQLENAHVSSITEIGVTIGGQLAQANLTNANLSGANLSGATLTGAIFTATVLVPSNQSVTQTSPSGAVATWSTPPGLPGATPGSCTPASGSTFPPGSTTVTCQVLDSNGDVATGTFVVKVTPQPPSTSVLIPSNGATLSGSTYLDAAAYNATSVKFLLLGGVYGYSPREVCTATPTYFGWLCRWNTRTVRNGNYALVSEASGAGGNAFSKISIIVKN
jgi:uncharacterized protein YjbI with pentapeptide repeats